MTHRDGHPPGAGVASSSAPDNSRPKEPVMQIDIKGRNVPVTDEIREHAARRLDKVARQVSELARIEIEIFKEPNPRVSDCHVAEATLYLKGVMLHSLNLMVDELARQVKRHRDKRRHRREARAAAVDRRMAAEAARTMGLAATQPTM